MGKLKLDDLFLEKTDVSKLYGGVCKCAITCIPPAGIIAENELTGAGSCEGTYYGSRISYRAN